jgi:hypothetical protein
VFNWWDRICFEGETGGGSGGKGDAGGTSSGGTAGGGGGTGTGTGTGATHVTVQMPPEDASRATLRAELAAERLDKGKLERQAQADRERHAQELATAKAEVEAKVKAATEPLTAQQVKFQNRLIDAELRGVAAEMGLMDPDLLLHPLLDRSGIKIDDDGNVTGTKEAFEALKTKKPEWFKAADGGTGTGTGGTGTGGAKKVTGGATPPEGGGGGAKPVDVTKMDKKAYEEYKRNLLRGLRTA